MLSKSETCWVSNWKNVVLNACWISKNYIKIEGMLSKCECIIYNDIMLSQFAIIVLKMLWKSGGTNSLSPVSPLLPPPEKESLMGGSVCTIFLPLNVNPSHLNKMRPPPPTKNLAQMNQRIKLYLFFKLYLLSICVTLLFLSKDQTLSTRSPVTLQPLAKVILEQKKFQQF